MRVTGLYILLLPVFSCTNSNNKNTAEKDVASDSVDAYDLLNFVLTDTVEIGLVMDGYKIISDIERLPPPVFHGKFIDHVSEVLSEKDTTYIRSQLRRRKDFNFYGLAKYGFTIVKVRELYKAKVYGDKFWEIVHTKYGPGLITVSMPIFNREFTKAYIRFGYSCGELCGGGEDMVIEKVNGKWIVFEHLGGWVS